MKKRFFEVHYVGQSKQKCKIKIKAKSKIKGKVKSKGYGKGQCVGRRMVYIVGHGVLFFLMVFF